MTQKIRKHRFHPYPDQADPKTFLVWGKNIISVGHMPTLISLYTICVDDIYFLMYLRPPRSKDRRPNILCWLIKNKLNFFITKQNYAAKSKYFFYNRLITF